MWEIFEHSSLVRKLPKIPSEVLKRYEKWKDIVTISGPEGLRLIKGFHDESLRGQWRGFRSSRLGKQYRIIYKIENKKLYVKVINITPHDYRRK
ncbi:MAG: type II toxin-antitoxin system mRNA interferase toxin, RelE/StbE family [Candidatus Scalindua sp.]|jgi:addiction module RelE/StbE family toxin|nr:type II toxin-antitoxin system mRNA interferase toxin, RelE/StbE family [Candidatus Scalindua sp.]MBT5304715.1 type II toxin-antitoxin system mRNA interferase toxin, RelE/StbE family [Candidatus Scalindua sp.]MBT6048564.1 type II toxin-antitoxin system mRNA interferase toxin, RelE/StbE family [Candidatus Scalindua sp.]MBT6229691.1 type II toxin-antitoxin system mRNA interferase toxin, RelE/StbE family [Candidatus Scalindua sp.]MBT6565112.1 type II toxin-antitoxin system mRNA interferase toxi